ncbi:MAG TPA: hypothetical protein VFE15_16810 [Marmoricola sp.]|jgi:hypothetical protein|nr:hypothetical protein [Marmoricola sp.]
MTTTQPHTRQKQWTTAAIWAGIGVLATLPAAAPVVGGTRHSLWTGGWCL